MLRTFHTLDMAVCDVSLRPPAEVRQVGTLLVPSAFWHARGLRAEWRPDTPQHPPTGISRSSSVAKERLPALSSFAADNPPRSSVCAGASRIPAQTLAAP